MFHTKSATNNSKEMKEETKKKTTIKMAQRHISLVFRVKLNWNTNEMNETVENDDNDELMSFSCFISLYIYMIIFFSSLLRC